MASSANHRVRSNQLLGLAVYEIPPQLDKTTENPGELSYADGARNEAVAKQHRLAL